MNKIRTLILFAFAMFGDAFYAHGTNFPNTLNSDSNLYIAVNDCEASLSGSITSGATTISVNATTCFPSVGYATIDSEAIKYTGKTGTTFTGCTRGSDGTTATAHTVGAVVFHAVLAAHHNVLKDELIASTTYFLQGSDVHIDTTTTPDQLGLGTAAPTAHLSVWGTGSSNTLSISSNTSGTPAALTVNNSGGTTITSGTITALLSPSITGTTLTSGRFALVGTGGLIGDDADFTNNGTTATMTGVSATNASVTTLLSSPGTTAGAVSTWSSTMTVSAPFNSAQGTDVASAGSINLDNATGNTIDITGTTTISTVTLSTGRYRLARFTGALTLDHSGVLVLPTAADITTAAGDWALFVGASGSVTRVAHYQRAAGTALSGGVAASQAEMEAASLTTVYTSPGTTKYHPGVAKTWASVTTSGGTPTLVGSYNISGIVDSGEGDITLTIDTDFSSAVYAVACGIDSPGTGSTARVVGFDSKAAGSVHILTHYLNVAVLVVSDWDFDCILMGDQ